MKHIWKKAMALGMSLVMVFSLTAVAAEPEPAPTDTEQAPAGISVVLDGQALSFTDVQPQMKDNRTFVPFRSVFEAMGATVEFDNATRVVSAERDGILVEFTLGSADVKVTENGQTETFQADVVPYVDAASGRTLIPGGLEPTHPDRQHHRHCQAGRGLWRQIPTDGSLCPRFRRPF